MSEKKVWFLKIILIHTRKKGIVESVTDKVGFFMFRVQLHEIYKANKQTDVINMPSRVCSFKVCNYFLVFINFVTDIFRLKYCGMTHISQ